MFQHSRNTNRQEVEMIREILKPSEKVLWTGRPNRFTYILGGMPMLMFGLVWGAVDLAILVGAIVTDGLHLPVILFLLVHAAPLYIGIWGMVRRNIEFKNTVYAYTESRLIIRQGLVGADYEMVGFDRILDMRVTTNPIEHMKGRGSITLSVGGVAVTKIIRLSGIEKPYEVLKNLQTISSEYAKGRPIPRDDEFDYD